MTENFVSDGREGKLFSVGNYHQFKKLVIVTHILLVISIGNVKGTVRRISILILFDLI